MKRIATPFLGQAAILVVALLGIAADRAFGQAFIDIGGHKIEISRAGQGGPAVVFEAGITDLRLWTGIQPRVAEFTSTLSYSHSGIGGSERSNGTRTPALVVQELHELLGRAGLEPPYVLVGHSMGGLFARVFATMYPREIAGLVLVDGAHERQVREFTRLDSSFLQIREAGLRSLEPGPRAEMDGLAQVLATGDLGVPGKLPDVPMVVITSTHSTPSTIPGAAKVWRDLQAEIFQSTTYGMHIVTSKSGHLIQRDEPELVVNAIRWVLEAARARK